MNKHNHKILLFPVSPQRAAAGTQREMSHGAGRWAGGGDRAAGEGTLVTHQPDEPLGENPGEAGRESITGLAAALQGNEATGRMLTMGS